MLSSYQTYFQYTNNMKQTLDRVAQDSVNAREIKYYKETIGSIKTIDDFMKNTRIYNYAIKAYGLEDMGYAKAFIRKVLESDMSDQDSFANRLSDAKYKNFAAAFDFGKTQSAKTVQTPEQTDRLIKTYDQTIAKIDSNLKEETRYFNAVIGSFKSLDDLFKNERARNYVFQAYGIDPKFYNYDTVRSVMTDDPNDPNGYVQTKIAPEISQLKQKIADLNDKLYNGNPTASETEKTNYLIKQYKKQLTTLNGYSDLAKAFNFKSDGSLDAGTPAQTEQQTKTLNERYVFNQPRITTTGALLNKEYYEANIGKVTSVDDIFHNMRLLDITLKSFGFDYGSVDMDDIRSALTKNPEDTDSPLHNKGKKYIDLYKAFNFNSDGTLEPGRMAQTPQQTSNTMSYYIIRYDDVYEAQEAEDAKMYKRYIHLTANLDDLLGTSPAAKAVRNYALKANGIDPDDVSLFKLKRILTSDPYDPKSYVRSLKDDRFVALAKDFNFTSDGKICAPRYAQSENELTRITKAYYIEKTKYDSTKNTKDAANKEVEYYRSQMQSLETIDQLVNNKRLVNVLLVSEGLKPDSVKPDTLRKILTSDLNDPKSFANVQDNLSYKKLAGSFNFNKDGIISPAKNQGVQDKRGLVETSDRYLHQMLENQVGDENVGARLALYFHRMLPNISNVYDILSDPALAEFTRTALGLPAETAQSNLDKQAAYIKSKLDIKDLQDPKKLEDLTKRFLALYDVNQGTSNPILALFNSGSNASISFENIATLSSLRASL